MPYPGTGQAIWLVTVHGRAASRDHADGEGEKDEEGEGEGGELEQGAYDHKLSVLRFRLDKLYDDPAQYPAPMTGTIEVHDERRKNADAPTEPQEESQEDPPARERTQASAPEREPTIKAKSVRNPKPDKPDRTQVLFGSSIKGPDFNKPAPVPTPAPVSLKQPLADKPKTGAAHDRPEPAPPPPAATATTVAAPAGEVTRDRAARLLAPEDMAPEAWPDSRAFEQRLLANAAKRAKKVSSAKAAPGAPRSPLSQPVGGDRRVLPPDAPDAAARPDVAVPAHQSADQVAQERALPAPVLLEPKLTKLSRDRSKAERQAGVPPVALAFVGWLQAALTERTIKYNETGALVHFVEHGMALVSPLIFKLYAATQVQESEVAEHAMQVQRELVKARLHVMGPGKSNILRYQVLGRGGAPTGSKLAAVVLSEPGRFVQPVPPVNPVLRLDSGGNDDVGC